MHIQKEEINEGYKFSYHPLDSNYEIYVKVIEQVLWEGIVELVRNAQKHSTEPCNIQLNTSIDTSMTEVTISVVDNGQGISTERMRSIFTPILKAAHDAPPFHGLFYLRLSAQRAGGNLDIQSREGKGTSVHILLPIFNITEIKKGSVYD